MGNLGKLLTVEWAAIPIYKKTMRIVARISYRAFIGSAVCISMRFDSSEGRSDAGVS